MYDLLEQAKVADKHLQAMEEDKQLSYSLNNLLQNSVRAVMRVAGNLEIAIGGYIALEDSQYFTKAAMFGAAGVSMYILDYYIFDRLKK